MPYVRVYKVRLLIPCKLAELGLSLQGSTDNPCKLLAHEMTVVSMSLQVYK